MQLLGVKYSGNLQLNQQWDTGKPFYLFGGGCILGLASSNTGAGDGTYVEVFAIRQAFDNQGTGELIHIAGTQGMVLYTKSSSNTIVLYSSDYSNIKIRLIFNYIV